MPNYQITLRNGTTQVVEADTHVNALRKVLSNYKFQLGSRGNADVEVKGVRVTKYFRCEQDNSKRVYQVLTEKQAIKIRQTIDTAYRHRNDVDSTRWVNLFPDKHFNGTWCVIVYWDDLDGEDHFTLSCSLCYYPNTRTLIDAEDFDMPKDLDDDFSDETRFDFSETITDADIDDALCTIDQYLQAVVACKLVPWEATHEAYYKCDGCGKRDYFVEGDWNWIGSDLAFCDTCYARIRQRIRNELYYVVESIVVDSSTNLYAPAVEILQRCAKPEDLTEQEKKWIQRVIVMSRL